MMNEKTGFKIVNSAYSSISEHDPSRVQYKMKEWVLPKPGMGALAVFTNLHCAKDAMFMNCWSGLIFECQYIPARFKCFADESSVAFENGDVITMFECSTFPCTFLHRSTFTPPDGTDYADAVKLTKIMHSTFSI